MYVRTYVRTYLCLSVCLPVRPSVSLYVCMFVCIYVCMSACIHAYTKYSYTHLFKITHRSMSVEKHTGCTAVPDFSPALHVSTCGTLNYPPRPCHQQLGPLIVLGYRGTSDQEVSSLMRVCVCVCIYISTYYRQGTCTYVNSHLGVDSIWGV